MRLLFVEDEAGIYIPLKTGLERRNYAVDIADDGDKDLRYALVNEYDCILLDLNLPGIDGLEVAKSRNKKMAAMV